MSFAIRLKELREEAGISQAQLAEIIGVGVSTVGMWESTQRVPSAKKLNKLVEYFGYPISYLLGETDSLHEVSTYTPTAPALSAEERQLLALFGQMTHAQKVRVIAYSEGLLSTGKAANAPKNLA